MVARSLAVLVVLALGACGGRPDPKLYVMSPAPEAQQAPDGPVRAVMRVRLPEYLNRPQIVARSTSNTLALDDDNRWGEPLDESVPRVMAQNLSHYLPDMRVVVPQDARGIKVPYEYLVALDSYEPDGKGNAVMRGQWQLRDMRSGKIVKSGGIHESAPMGSAAAPDAVAAMNEVLTEASRQIADSSAGQVAAR